MDQETIRNACQGDLEAFGKIVVEYKGFLMAVVYPLIRDPGLAEDVLQEAYLQVFRSLSGYRGGNFKHWLARIAANKALDWKRQEKGKNREHLLDDHEGELERITDGISTEDLVIRKDPSAKLRQICDRLAPEHRAALLGFYLEGKSYHSLALEAGISVKTVESRLYRGRKMLKTMWEED